MGVWAEEERGKGVVDILEVVTILVAISTQNRRQQAVRVASLTRGVVANGLMQPAAPQVPAVVQAGRTAPQSQPKEM